MKTPERILQTSLSLFNEEGVIKTTTNHIADEMEISPGNLYYHFKNKEEIVYQLFQRYKKTVTETLTVPEEQSLDIEDMWFYLHLIFENIWQYRFIYRNLDHVMSMSQRLNRQFKQLMALKRKTAEGIFNNLASNNRLHAGKEEIQALSVNMVLVITYWVGYCRITPPTDNQSGQGVYHAMSLVAPFLPDERRRLLQQLAREYL